MSKEAINFLELWFITINGAVRGMIIPTLGKKTPTTLEELKNDPCVKKNSSIDGSSCGFADVNNSDMKLKPDVNSIFELPKVGEHRRVVCFCNLIYRNSDAFHVMDSRNVLNKVVQKYLEPKDLEFFIKVEPEFFLTKKGKHEAFDNQTYAYVYPQSPGDKILKDICLELKKQEIPVKILHHECGKAQYEVELDFVTVLKQADNISLFKNLCKVVCLKNNIDCTFMPKPWAKEAGSGLHIHMRLFNKKTGKNVFGVEGKPNTISKTAEYFIGGVLSHVKPLTAMSNASINSYKRLIPHFEAPTIISWGKFNRTVLLRIPQFGAPKNAAIEIRSPDLTANIYLLLAGLIASGVEGINNKTEPQPESVGNLFDSDDKNLKYLPGTFKEALDCLRKDDFFKGVLGEGCYKQYLKVKDQQVRQYDNFVVTDFEIKNDIEYH